LSIFDELTSNEEEELLNKLANYISKLGMEAPAIIFLEMLKPISVLASQTTLYTAAPVLELFGIRGYRYTKLFSKRDSVERLIEKIEKLVENAKNKKHSNRCAPT